MLTPYVQCGIVWQLFHLFFHKVHSVGNKVRLGNSCGGKELVGIVFVISLLCQRIAYKEELHFVYLVYQAHLYPWVLYSLALGVVLARIKCHLCFLEGYALVSAIREIHKEAFAYRQ